MSRQERAFKSYWSKPGAAMSLGCVGCPDQATCGGQTVIGPGFNCLDHCCGKPDACPAVCPHALTFADRIREVRGLSLETPLAAPLARPDLPHHLTMLFHGSALAAPVPASAVAVPLYRFFNRFADCRFDTRESIAETFKIDPATDILLSGVAQDKEVEGWWRLERRGRLKAVANFRRLGVSMVTVPNFSLMVDRPRWDDLHAMRRIAVCYHEIVSEGQPAALHVNGRTEWDFARWTDYIVAHPEVTHIAYEFTTCGKTPNRMMQHAVWLIELAQNVGRPLGLVLRGGLPVVGLLADYYDIIFIDTSPFEKAQHREVAWVDNEGQRRWMKQMTTANERLDALLADNIRVSRDWFETLLPKFKLAA